MKDVLLGKMRRRSAHRQAMVARKERERNTEMPYLLTTTDGTERDGMGGTGNGRGCAGREIGSLGFLFIFILIFLNFFHSTDVVQF